MRRELEDAIAIHRAARAAREGVPHPLLLERAFASRRPFAGADRRGAGFRGFGASVSSLTLNLLAIGTFTRSTEASAQTGAPTDGSSAFMQWLGVNVIATENLGDGAGALVRYEGSRTNQMRHSRAMENAVYTTTGTPTITADAANGPDGAAEATRIQCASTDARHQAMSGLTNGAKYAASCWGKSPAGGTNIVHRVNNVDQGFGTLSAPTTYARRVHVVTLGATTQNFFAMEGRTCPGFASGTRDGHLDLIQFELGAFPTSAIRTTTAAVTRGADTHTLTPGELPAWVRSRARFDQCSPEWATADLASGDEFWVLSLDNNQNGLRFRHNGTDVRFEAIEANTVRAQSAALSFARNALLGALEWNPAAGTVSVGGVAGATGTAWTWGAPASGARLGGIFSGAGEAFARFSTQITGIAA